MRGGCALRSQKWISRTNDNPTICADPNTARFDESFAGERQMDDPSFDGRHGIERHGMVRGHDALRGITRKTFQEFHAAQSISVHIDKAAPLNGAQFVLEEQAKHMLEGVKMRPPLPNEKATVRRRDIDPHMDGAFIGPCSKRHCRLDGQLVQERLRHLDGT